MQAAESVVGASEQNPGHEKQTPTKRGARQLANNNILSPRSLLTKKGQKNANSDDPEETHPVDLTVDHPLKSIELKGETPVGSADGVESYKKPGKRWKAIATTIEPAEENGVDEKISQPLKRKRATKEDIITEKAGTRATSPPTTKAKGITAKAEEQTTEEDERLNAPLRKRKFKETTVKKDIANQKRGIKKGAESLKKPTITRKTKEEKEAEAMPLATRSKGLQMFIGAHVSSAKGSPPVFPFDSRAYVTSIELKHILQPRSA